jgi:hypothetical protein
LLDRRAQKASQRDCRQVSLDLLFGRILDCLGG